MGIARCRISFDAFASLARCSGHRKCPTSLKTSRASVIELAGFICVVLVSGGWGLYTALVAVVWLNPSGMVVSHPNISHMILTLAFEHTPFNRRQVHQV